MFKCPTCERSMSIPLGGANDLPQNLHLRFEVEVAGYMSKIASNSEVCCDECIDRHNGPAEVFCCTCCQFLCMYCHDYHRNSRKLSKHNMVGLDKEGAKQLQATMKPREHYCSQPYHKDNKLNFHCETCNLMLCRDCTTVAHKDHGVTELSIFAEGYRGDMRRTLQCVQDTLAGAIDASMKTMKQVEASKQEAERVIKQGITKLQQAIEERKKALLSELDNIALTQTTSLTLQMEQLEKIQQDISHYPEVTSHILQTHTDHELVAMGGLIPPELKATLKKVQNVSSVSSLYGRITAEAQTDFLEQEVLKFGEFYYQIPIPCKSIISFPSLSRIEKKYLMKLETRMSNGEKCRHGGVQVEAEMRSKANNGAVVYGEVEDHRDGTYTITLTPQTAGPHQLVITMDGQHVQNSPHDLDVRPRPDYTTLCDAQQAIRCSQPVCAAIHDNGDIYVLSSDNCIYVFDQTGKLKNTIGSMGNGDGQFMYPGGIYIKGDVLYVADCRNHRIQKLTSRGEFLHKFGQQGSGEGQFDGPSAVIVDSNNRLIVADTDNHRIQILNDYGGWIWTINLDIDDEMINYPLNLALDPQGNIHVVGHNSNAIKVFTKEGVYVREYGDGSESGIAIADKGYSLVSKADADDGGTISIYDPEGFKINTLRGLSDPYGIALDPGEGSLYVADSTANIVLKYYA